MNILISGVGGQHDIDVASAFVSGYQSTGGTWNGTIIQRGNENLASSIAYATANNIRVIIRSVTGMSSSIATAESNFPNIQLFMPAGSNLNIEVYTGNLNAIIITGAGVNSNLTGYKTEFYGLDTISGNNNESSYSNGYIAGQICYIKDTLNCSFWEARLRARITGSQNNVYNNVNGFGKININDAINYAGNISLGNIGSITATLNDTTGAVAVAMSEVTNAMQYKLYKNNVLLSSQTSLTYNDTITRQVKPNGNYVYSYKAITEDEETETEETTVKYNSYKGILSF